MDQVKLKKLDEPFYTAEQIIVPPDLPEVLKEFTKAAIKTQPPDLLEWSANYFRARATGQKLPVKDRLEMLPDDYDDLTLGLLKILHRELGHKNVVDLAEIQEHWVGLGLAPSKFEEISSVGQLAATVEWHRFIVVTCAKLSQKMEDIFKNFCLVLTNEPDGNNPMVPFSLFRDAYQFVADTIEGIDVGIQEKFLTYLTGISEKQRGMVSPADFTHRDCPPMQKPPHVPGSANVSEPIATPAPVPAVRKSQETAIKRVSQDTPVKRQSAPTEPPIPEEHIQSDTVTDDEGEMTSDEENNVSTDD